MESDINLWAHLIGFAVYTGVTAALVAIAIPLITAEEDPLRRARIAASVLRVYDPLSLAALGVAIMTGAFSLTAYKAALRGAFFERMGGPLAWKLFFTFILINVATYMAFGIGHRIVRATDAGEPPDAAQLDSFMRRLRISAMLALLLVAIIVWEALRLGGSALAPIAAG